MPSLGVLELLILVVIVGLPVGLILYFAWWRPRPNQPRGFEVKPSNTPDPPDRRWPACPPRPPPRVKASAAGGGLNLRLFRRRNSTAPPPHGTEVTPRVRKVSVP